MDTRAESGEENLYFREVLSVTHILPVPTFLVPATVSVPVCQVSRVVQEAGAMEVSGIGAGKGSSPGTSAPAAVVPSAAGSDGHGAPAMVRAEGTDRPGG